ncbi:MAG: hypothetical protein WAZ19_16565 [Anaerolineae bacterium]
MLPADDNRAPSPPADGEHDLDRLRRILLGIEQDRLEILTTDVEDLRLLLADKEALTALLSPSIEAAIQERVTQDPSQLVEILYPVIGQSVVRAVSEAIQDLARNVDARTRSTLTPNAALRRVRGMASGVSNAEMVLRDALPFKVTEVFAIHRETGLLLRHLSLNAEAAPDRDLVSGMLTAIRDFAADAFGESEGGELASVDYGDRRILLEAGEFVYLAVVVVGIEPAGFRSQMRDLIYTIENRYRFLLRNFRGDTADFTSLDSLISELHGDAPQATPRRASKPLSSRQKIVFVSIALFIVACSILACLAGIWTIRAVKKIESLPQPTSWHETAPTVSPETDFRALILQPPLVYLRKDDPW